MGLINKIKNAYFNMLINSKSFQNQSSVSTYYNGHIYHMTSYDLVTFNDAPSSDNMYQVISVLNSYKYYSDFTMFPIEKNGKIIAVEYAKIGANDSLYSYEKRKIRRAQRYSERKEFDYKIGFFIEFVNLYSYLTENNIECDNLSSLFFEFYDSISDDSTYDSALFIRNLDALKIVDKIDILSSQQKLLSFIYELLGLLQRIRIEELGDIEKRKNFFLSNDLFRLFKTSLVDNKIIEIEDLKNALIDQASHISWYYDSWDAEIPYDSRYIACPFDSSFDSHCLFIEMDELELIKENGNVSYFTAKSQRLKSSYGDDYFVILSKDYDIKKYYDQMPSIFDKHFFKLLYSSDKNQACGYLLDGVSIKVNPTLEDKQIIDDTNLFIVLCKMYKCLRNLQSKNQYINIPLLLSDFSYNVNEVELINHSIFLDDDSSNNVEFCNDIIVDFVMDLVKRYANYKIEGNRVVFDEMSDIRCMSPAFILEVTNYLLDDPNYSKENTYNALEMTFNNLESFDGHNFYEKYIVSPKKLPFVFEDMVDKSKVISQDDNETIYELPNGNVARIFKKSSKAKNALENLLNIIQLHLQNNLRFGDVQTVKKIIYKRKLKKVTSKKNSYSTFVISGVIYENKVEGITIRDLALNPYGFDNMRMLSVLERFFFMCYDISAKVVPYLILDNAGSWHIQLGSFSTQDLSYSHFPFELYKYIKETILDRLNISMYSFDIKYRVFANNENGYYVSELHELIYNAQLLLKGRCEKHKIWYRKDMGVCPLCHKDSMLLSSYKKLNTEKSNSSSIPYDLLKDNIEVLSPIILNKASDNTQKVEMYEYLINLSKKNREISKFIEIPCLKLLDDDYNLIGYLYKEDEVSLKWKDVFKYVIKSAIISSYLKVLIELEKNGLYVDENIVAAFKPIGSYSKSDFKIKLTDIFAIKKIDSEFSYKNTYESLKSFGLNAKNLVRTSGYDKALCELSNTHVDKLLHAINMLSGFDKYCDIHNIYYNSKEDLICPECKKIHGLSYLKKDNKKLNLLSDEGGEALCYILDNRLMLKRFRVDKKTKKLDPKDIEHNVIVCKELMAKSEILSNTLEKGYDFELVLPKGFEYEDKIYDTSKVTGIVFETIENSKPIRILENNKNKDKYHITRQNLFEICIGIAHAMMYLHENGIYMGDVSTNNFLFKPEDKIKFPYVIDMNSVGTKNEQSYMFTRDYVDPKAIEEKHVKTNASTDLYALAVLSFYLLTSINPFAGTYKNGGVNMSLADRKKNKISVLGDHDVILPPIFKWDWMSDDLVNAFLDIFERDKRYNIADILIQEYERLFGVEYPFHYKNSVEETKKEDETEELEEKETRTQSLKEVSFDTVVVETQIQKSDDDSKPESVDSKNTSSNGPTLRLVREIKDKDNMCILSNHYDYLQKNDYNQNLRRRFLVHDGVDEIYFSTLGTGMFDNMTHDGNSLNDIPYYENNSKRLFAVQMDPIYGSNVLKFSSSQVSTSNITIMSHTDILSIPYTDTFIYVSKDGFLMKYSAKDDSSLSISQVQMYNLESHRISLNTRYSSNDLASKEVAYVYVMENIVNAYHLKRVQIYVDMVSNKWLVVADTESFDKLFMYDEKTGIIGEIGMSDIAKDVLDDIKSHMSGCIYIKNALYYLTEGKIVSVNISSGNVKEFDCSVADDNSRLEMIPNGFRIFTKTAIYDYVSN